MDIVNCDCHCHVDTATVMHNTSATTCVMVALSSPTEIPGSLQVQSSVLILLRTPIWVFNPSGAWCILTGSTL
ncbi:hypothetical protein P7K49_030972 [Saguinus oedipus]|uniref:Uncharacterized protein n=1 Tax=Saguinus oedipus TaxID=9490 RepID=A0ABQ9U4V9_SAGOE|nr:hypothetical protein P7K49_030972 [Saguinus oedipus]